MTAEAQGLVLDADVPATGLRIVAPHEIPKRGKSTLACPIHNVRLNRAALSASRRSKENDEIQRRPHFKWSLVLLLLVVLRYPVLFAADNERDIHQFAHTAWGAKEGCPGSIRALAQTTDGYLWLGTWRGLYRFDGVGFERYVPLSGGVFPPGRVYSLLALSNGDLWVGFSGSISRLRAGDLKNYATDEGIPDGIVWGLAQDADGVIWAASDGGLLRFEGERWKEVGADWNYPGKSATAVFLDRERTFWVATENTIVFLQLGSRRFQSTGIRIRQVAQIAEAPNRQLWMAETTRAVRPISLHGNQKPADNTEIRVGSVAILFDRDGALWVTSIGDGMRHAPAPERLHGKIAQFGAGVESFTGKDGLSGDDVRAIMQDREGTVWAATTNGLDRFRKTHVVPMSFPINPSQTAMAPGDGGDVWINSVGEITRVHGLKVYAMGLQADNANTAYRDARGAIWWAGAKFLYRFRNGQYSRLELPREIAMSYGETQISEDSSGALWLAAQLEGLFYWKNGVWHHLVTPPEVGKLSPLVAFTDWMGRVWFGYAGGTIVIVNQGAIQRVFTKDETRVGSVRAIQGRDRHIWVGGDSGLVFFDGNRFRPVGPAPAGTWEAIAGIAESADNSLWLIESWGIIHIPTAEVGRALEHPGYGVQYELFDSRDGLPGGLVMNRAESPMTQGTDGRLWFLTTNGLAWLDPAKISRNALPPPVSIRLLTADRKQYATWTHLTLPAGTANLQIDYTALSLSIPERVRFRYKLEEIDRNWQDAGTRREAFYTQLGPGKYRFRVIACNNDGVWNEEGAALDFSIAPAWYQTTFFRSLCVAVSLLLLWSLFRLRVQQVERRFAIGLEARVNERTRIARELHDTLLQSFQGLLLRFQAATNLLPNRPDEAKRRLEGAIDQAAQAITEGRDAVHELRASTAPVSDLDVAIRSLGEQLMADHGGENPPMFSLQVEGTPRELQPILRDEVFRIAGEALRNAFRHGKARRVEAEIRYDQNRLRLRLRDDGKGIDPKLLDQDGKPGHWGLPGMRERAKLIGGRLDVWSQLDSGTEVELSVPASLAYATSRSPRWPLLPSWLGRAFSRREKA